MNKPDFHVHQILDWCDAHRERSGQWPDLDSGRVAEAPDEKWLNIDMDLRLGLRGLPGGWSLARLLAEFRGRRNTSELPRHTEEQILAWADAHRKRTRRWPTFGSGPVVDAPDENWSAIDMALHAGTRGLPGGSTLAKLLKQERGVRTRRKNARRRAVRPPVAALDEPAPKRPNMAWAECRARRSRFNRPPLTVDMILAWAGAFHDRTGEWPTTSSGRIELAPDETWSGVNLALHRGLRGLPPGSSLAELLARHRGVRKRKEPPALCVEEILAWAEAHFARTGVWPTESSGPIAEAPGETWTSIAQAMCRARRGLRSGTLARLLGRHGGVFKRRRRPQLSLEAILAWADSFHERYGDWPDANSGRIDEAPAETWGGVQNALRDGDRGLPVGLSLAKLLMEHRGVRNHLALAPLTEERILAWADAFRAPHGRWPTRLSGPIDEAPGENWQAVDVALNAGRRGLPGGSSVARLLAKHRGCRNRLGLAALTVEQILAWADRYFERHGHWPMVASRAIPEAPGETWCGIDRALKWGRRGLAAGSSLARLFDAHRGTHKANFNSTLDVETILQWADAFHDRHGTWPNINSGLIRESGGTSWNAVNIALRNGSRGLPGGSSLAKLLAERRGARHRFDLPPLTVDQVLAWADAHHAKFGRWPTQQSGKVDGAPSESWSAIDQALESGRRGFAGGSSLPKLLNQYRRGPAAPEAAASLAVNQPANLETLAAVGQ